MHGRPLHARKTTACTEDHCMHGRPLHARKTTLALVSRAPLQKIEAYRRRMGWTISWYSSFDSDFNYDFHVTLDETVAPVEYNYTDKATLLEKGERYFTDGESHGLSVFLCDGNGVLIRRSISHAASPVPRHGRSLRSSDRLMFAPVDRVVRYPNNSSSRPAPMVPPVTSKSSTVWGSRNTPVA